MGMMSPSFPGEVDRPRIALSEAASLCPARCNRPERGGCPGEGLVAGCGGAMSPHVLESIKKSNNRLSGYVVLFMECAIEENIHRKGKTCAVNWIAHDYIAEANRPRRAVFAVRFDWGSRS